MPYQAPYIDASGLHIPTYQDLEDYLVQQAQAIFGADIYLGADSQDFQDIAARAQALYDTCLTAQQAYNNRSPVSATSTALDALVAINGILRQGATYSIATVTLTGDPFTVITNGVVGDSNGNAWALPASITLDSGGSATATATCETAGPISAQASTINIILTPTSGWTSVNNTYAATPGRSVETDAELRARQAVSVANPSQALTTGILGSVLNVSGVASAQLYENDTASPVAYINDVYNPSNFPAHSITLVVDGGADADIANMIALRKTPGCYTNGDQSVTIYDQFGVASTIRFYRPTTQTIDVAITIKALTGYSVTVGTALVQAVADYINSLVAGQNVYLSQLEKAALSAITNDKLPQFSVTSLTASIDPASPASSDITMDFNWRAITTTSNITLTVV